MAGGNSGQNAPELLGEVYNELRQLAAHWLAQERPGQTLQATALVHEAWLRLAHKEHATWKEPQHFFSAAATAMRHILIDNARRKRRPKHGGDRSRVRLEEVAVAAEPLPAERLLALDEALARLANEDPEAARLVELRFFVGLGHQEAAQLLGLTRAQADGLWAYARTWLFHELSRNPAANLPGQSP